MANLLTFCLISMTFDVSTRIKTRTVSFVLIQRNAFFCCRDKRMSHFSISCTFQEISSKSILPRLAYDLGRMGDARKNAPVVAPCPHIFFPKTTSLTNS
uniref:Secreted protein n=1 Tax=Parascaris univalens TaxID=6257 RepID=A0A915AVL1_PARUN